MQSSSSKRSGSFGYGLPLPTSLPTPDPSPNFSTSSYNDSHPSPLLLPSSSLPASKPNLVSAPSAHPASSVPKSKSKAASAKSQRKINHSIIEKRRREKINACLAELREIVPLETGGGSPDGDSKGEFKLEILVRTVDYVKDLQSQIRRLESQSSASSSNAPVLARSKRDLSPWQGIETESECGLSPSPADLASDMDMSVEGDSSPGPAPTFAHPPPPAPPAPQASTDSLPNFYGHHQPHLYSRQSAPSFVPIGLQRLPSISAMLPFPGPPPAPSNFSRAHSSFSNPTSSFSSLPGARPDFALHHMPKRNEPQGKDELRAAEVLLAISSPELRGIGGSGEDLEDWSLEGRVI